MKLLIAEDERNLNKLIADKLNSEGYVTDVCFDGREALDFLSMSTYDAVILDIMMPYVDGFGVLSELRRRGSDVPVLFLTARDAVDDRVHGLDLGASDYITKPFSFEELMARIRVITRKSTGSISNTFTLADLVLDIKSRVVTRSGNVIDLSAKEYALLEYMMRNKGNILSREQIENNVWNFDYEGGTNVVDVYIRYLRVKIDKSYEPKLIHTVRGLGYVMKEEL